MTVHGTARQAASASSPTPTIRLTDTLSGQTRPLVPLEPGHVRIYSCGPTVYGPAHIGNFRSFLFADLLVRYLRWRGLRVTWVMNVTDVDDKIIRGAAEAGVTIDDLADRWLERFLADAEALGMTRPDALPRATRHIEPMAALVRALLERDHAYRTEDGSIFFRITSWPAYGALARLDPEQLRVGERVEADEYGKGDVRDFALWKGPKPGVPSWESEVGPGRPGWHVECSAMSMQYLGPSFDIHTGGVDLIFPHHEDEIAQSEAATGRPFVGTWLHCAHLRLAGEKMAKSTGNIHRVVDLLETGVPSRALRYALLAVHYRQALDYTGASLAAAAAAVDRLDALMATLEAYAEDRADALDLPDALEAARAGFVAALDDDLNISAALAAVFELVREVNRRIADRALSTNDAGRVAALLRDLDRVLGVLPEPPATLPADAAGLLEARAAARAARDWAASDRLRDELAGLGIAVEDTRDGQRWRRTEGAP
jgi:cysteinyl-tRNA synthetase